MPLLADFFTASSSVWLAGPERLMLAIAGFLALAVTQSTPSRMSAFVPEPSHPSLGVVLGRNRARNMRAVPVAVGVFAVAGAVDVLDHVEVRVGIDARVDHVGVHVRNGSRAVPRLGRARVGVYLVDAPGQRLCRGTVGLVGLHALHPLVGAHRTEAPVGDAGGEAL